MYYECITLSFCYPVVFASSFWVIVDFIQKGLWTLILIGPKKKNNWIEQYKHGQLDINLMEKCFYVVLGHAYTVCSFPVVVGKVYIQLSTYYNPHNTTPFQIITEIKNILNIFVQTSKSLCHIFLLFVYTSVYFAIA